MNVEHVEVMVEEPSMAEALSFILPLLLDQVSFTIYRHQCKDDLLTHLPGRLKGYASWLPESWRILVVLDRDDDDCVALKRRIEQFIADAGLAGRARRVSDSVWRVVSRFAVEELEAWYFGDWEAVRRAYPRVSVSVPSQARYRRPDEIAGGTWEAFERVLQNAGYFAGGLRKIEAARAVARHMNPDRNSSPSFGALRDVLRETVASADS